MRNRNKQEHKQEQKQEHRESFDLIHTGVSKTGHSVSLKKMKQGTKQGGEQDGYVIQHGPRSRYTPFLDRAEDLYALFMKDVTNPSSPALRNPKAALPMSSALSETNTHGITKLVPRATLIFPGRRQRTKRTTGAPIVNKKKGL